jgi:hypothetical protein
LIKGLVRNPICIGSAHDGKGHVFDVLLAMCIVVGEVLIIFIVAQHSLAKNALVASSQAVLDNS